MTGDPRSQGPTFSNQLVYLMIWFFLGLILSGPMARIPLSEWGFYLAQERFIITLERIRTMGQASSPEILRLRMVYWLGILLFWAPNYWGRVA